MFIPVTKPLFAWDCLEDNPTLNIIQKFFDSLPDSELLESLRIHRGKGRSDYPMHVLWRTALLSILLRHRWIETTLDELQRNSCLWPLICIERADQAPKKWNMTRFLAVLGTQPHLIHLRNLFNKIILRLADAVGDLGVNLAGDATSLKARADKEPSDTSLPQPDGGRKEYTNDEGRVIRVIEWFGYKAHLLVDTKHEVVVAYVITPASTHDSQAIEALLQQAAANLPAEESAPTSKDQNCKEEIPKHRIRTLAYDKAADSGAVHQLLDKYSIKPVIQNRSCWKQETERMLPGHDGRSNIVHDEAGTIYCYDKVSDPPVRHQMAYIGQEPDRRTIKYRCPAMHSGWQCPSHDRCNCQKSYGKTVRVARDIDLRRFPPIPRATKQFERLYKGRTSVERVNARLKVYWGADDGNITGAARFHAFFGIVMVVHGTMATLLAAAPRREGTLGKMKLSHVAQKIKDKIDEYNAA